MKRKLITLSLILLSAILISQSCKKADSLNSNQKDLITEKFFNTPPGTNPQVLRVIENLKEQNKRTGFIGELAIKEGYAAWDKSIIKVVPYTATSQANFTGFNIGGTPSDTIAYIPLILENTRYVNSFIYAKLNGNLSLKLFRGREYELHGFDSAKADNAGSFTKQLILLNNSVFGHKNFQINDSRIFPQAPGKHLRNTRFHLQADTTQPTSLWVTYWGTITHYGCGGSYPPCTSDYCDMCSGCVTTTYGYIQVWIDTDTQSSPTGGGGGNPSGGGGSGSPNVPGGGSGNPSCTIIQNGEMPASCGGGNNNQQPVTVLEGNVPVLQPEETYIGDLESDVFQYTNDPAIELQKYMNCFNQIPSAGATYSVKICADIPVNSDPYKINTSSSAGHVFLTLTKANGSNSVTQSFGFYPKHGFASLGGIPVDSKVVDDHIHEYNASLTMNVSEQSFLSVISFSLIQEPWNYDLNGENCAKFALISFNSGRTNPLFVPDTYSTLGAYCGKTPVGLYRRLKYLKDNNDPESNNIQIGVFTSPQSHGPCN